MDWTPESIKPNPGQKVIATYKNKLGRKRTITAWWIHNPLDATAGGAK